MGWFLKLNYTEESKSFVYTIRFNLKQIFFYNQLINNKLVLEILSQEVYCRFHLGLLLSLQY